MDRRACIQGLAACAVDASVPAPAFELELELPSQAKTSWDSVPSIIILAADDDPRVEAMEAAIRAWNTELLWMGTTFRLGAPRHRAVAIGADAAHTIHDAGRGDTSKRQRAIELRNRFEQIPYDIVVILADGPFVAFQTWLSFRPLKALVAICSEPVHARVLPYVAAHELGHAIGLKHVDDPVALMCGGRPHCRPSAGNGVPLLTPAERQAVVDMYPADWSSRAPFPDRRSG